MSKPLTGSDGGMSFWEHLDILRATLIRIVVVWCLFSVVAFIFKTEVFSVVLAPRNSGFITYRWLENICIGMGLSVPDAFDVELINTGLARQFMIHMKTAFCVGLLFVSPYALYEIFLFISPALYRNERKYASGIIVSGYAMFVIGILLSYFVIFPITFRFLGTYQVADDVVNMISLESYMATLIMMCLCMGVVCELPVLSWLLAKMGIISSSFMAAYRRHAVVVILTVAAVITPTSDVFTLLLVSLPIWLLYETSIFLARYVEKGRVDETSDLGLTK